MIFSIFCHHMHYLFVILTVFFEAQNFYILMELNVPMFSVVTCPCTVIFEKLLPNLQSYRFMFLSKNFIAYILVLDPLPAQFWISWEAAFQNLWCTDT
jgi:hypothetical protein